MLTTPTITTFSVPSIIQSVTEKHYLKPILTEIQVLSFSQGRHNWIPPEDSDTKSTARGEKQSVPRASLFSLLLVFPLLQVYSRNQWTIPLPGLTVDYYMYFYYMCTCEEGNCALSTQTGKTSSVLKKKKTHNITCKNKGAIVCNGSENIRIVDMYGCKRKTNILILLNLY